MASRKRVFAIDQYPWVVDVHNRTLSAYAMFTIAHCLIVLGFRVPYRLKFEGSPWERLDLASRIPGVGICSH